MTACIVGWAHTPFGKLEADDLESLVGTVTRGAIDDAGIAPGDVDEIFFAHFGGGFIKEQFLSSLPLEAASALRFKPSTRVENACATGSAAWPRAWPGRSSTAARGPWSSSWRATASSSWR